MNRNPFIRSVLQLQLALYTLFERPFLGGRLGSIVVKADAHCSARRRRRVREGSNPASDYKNIFRKTLSSL